MTTPQDGCAWIIGASSGIGRSDRLWRIEGMSELHFDPAGRVTAHIDHWDAAGQVYETLPGIGWLLGMLRRRIEG